MTRGIVTFTWVLLTIIFFLLTIIGLALPVFPQLPFLIAGFFCLSKASPRFHRWLTNTRVYRKIFGRLNYQIQEKKKELTQREMKWYETIYIKIMTAFMIQE